MILASQSPRRRELLGLIENNFSIIPAKGEEYVPQGTPARAAVEMLAKQKAQEIAEQHCGEIIVAADTVVCLDGVIMGKPRSEENAREMLKRLSGNTHEVYTGVCVIFKDGSMECFSEETLVEFFELSDEEIANYAATGDPMDKAGAYGIQGRGALLVKGIKGDYYNVMGLPVGRLARVLARNCRL